MQRSPSPSQLLSPNSANLQRQQLELPNLVTSPDLERDFASPVQTPIVNEQHHTAESGTRKTFKTEYKSKFTPFDQYVYNEVTDSFVKPQICNDPTSGSTDSSHMPASRSAQELASLAQDPSHQANEPWYKEVVRRNEKANEYRYKSEVGHNSPLLQPAANLRAESPYWAPSEASGTTQGSNGGDHMAATGSSGSQFSDTQTVTTDIYDSRQQQIKFTPHDYKRDHLIAHMANNHNFRDQHNRDALVTPKANGTSNRAVTSSTARSTTRTPAQIRSRSQSTRRQPVNPNPSKQPVAPSLSSTSKSHQTTPIRRPTPRATKPATNTVTSSTTVTKTAATNRPSPRLATARTTPNSASSTRGPTTTSSRAAPTSTTVKRSTGVSGPQATASRLNGVAGRSPAISTTSSAKRTPTTTASGNKPHVTPKQSVESSLSSSNRRPVSTSATKTPTSARTGISTSSSGTRSAASSHRGSTSNSSSSSAKNSISAQGSSSKASANNAVKSIKTPKAVAAAAAVAAASLAAVASTLSSQETGTVNQELGQENDKDQKSEPSTATISHEPESNSNVVAEDQKVDDSESVGKSEELEPNEENIHQTLESGNLIFTTTEAGNMLADELAEAEKEARLSSVRNAQDSSAKSEDPGDMKTELDDSPLDGAHQGHKEPKAVAVDSTSVGAFKEDEDVHDEMTKTSNDQHLPEDNNEEWPITLSKDRDLLASITQDEALVKKLKGDCSDVLNSVGDDDLKSNDSKSNNQLDSGEDLFNGIPRGLVSNSSSEFNPDNPVAHNQEALYQNANESEEPYSIMPSDTQLDDYSSPIRDHETFNVITSEPIDVAGDTDIQNKTELPTELDSDHEKLELGSENDADPSVNPSNGSQPQNEDNRSPDMDIVKAKESPVLHSESTSNQNSHQNETQTSHDLKTNELSDDEAAATDNLLRLNDETPKVETREELEQYHDDVSENPDVAPSAQDQSPGDMNVQENLEDHGSGLKLDLESESGDGKKALEEIQEQRFTETIIEKLENDQEILKTSEVEPHVIQPQDVHITNDHFDRDSVHSDLIEEQNVNPISKDEISEMPNDTLSEPNEVNTNGHVIESPDPQEKRPVSPEELVADKLMGAIGLSDQLFGSAELIQRNQVAQESVGQQDSEHKVKDVATSSSSSSSSSSSDSESGDDSLKPGESTSRNHDETKDVHELPSSTANLTSESEEKDNDEPRAEPTIMNDYPFEMVAAELQSDSQNTGPALIGTTSDQSAEDKISPDFMKHDDPDNHDAKDNPHEEAEDDLRSERAAKEERPADVGTDEKLIDSTTLEPEQTTQKLDAELTEPDAATKSLSSSESDIYVAKMEQAPSREKADLMNEHSTEDNKNDLLMGDHHEDMMDSTDRINLNDNLDEDENQKLSNRLTNSDDELILSPRNFNYNFGSNNNHNDDSDGDLDRAKTAAVGSTDIKLLAELDLMARDDCLDGDLRLSDGSSATFETAASAAESRFELMTGNKHLDQVAHGGKEPDKPHVSYLIDGKSPLADISASDDDDDDDIDDVTATLHAERAKDVFANEQVASTGAPDLPARSWATTVDDINTSSDRIAEATTTVVGSTVAAENLISDLGSKTQE